MSQSTIRQALSTETSAFRSRVAIIEVNAISVKVGVFPAATRNRTVYDEAWDIRIIFVCCYPYSCFSLASRGNPHNELGAMNHTTYAGWDYRSVSLHRVRSSRWPTGGLTVSYSLAPELECTAVNSTSCSTVCSAGQSSF